MSRSLVSIAAWDPCRRRRWVVEPEVGHHFLQLAFAVGGADNFLVRELEDDLALLARASICSGVRGSFCGRRGLLRPCRRLALCWPAAGGAPSALACSSPARSARLLRASVSNLASRAVSAVGDALGGAARRCISRAPSRGRARRRRDGREPEPVEHVEDGLVVGLRRDGWAGPAADRVTTTRSDGRPCQKLHTRLLDPARGG